MPIQIKRNNTVIGKCLNLPSIVLLDAIKAGVWITSLDGITEYVNPSLCNLLGYRSEEIINRPVLDFIDPINRGQVRSNIQKRNEGISESYTFTLYKKDGSSKLVVIAANPLQDSSGKIIGAMALITEYVASEATFAMEHQEKKNSTIQCSNLTLYPGSIEYSIDGQKEELSYFTFKLLSYFVQNNGRVISRSELIENVWENKSDHDRVIDAHILSLRKKLKNFHGTLKTVYGMGYILKTKESQNNLTNKKRLKKIN